MADVLFPARKRCRTCRGGLGLRPGDEVCLGLYCSRRCAGAPPISTKVEDAPRECKTQRDGGWTFKRRYRAESEIPQVLREDPSTSWYVCNYCLGIHIGHTRMGQAEQFRMFAATDITKDLADLLVKLRGQATRVQVARAAGIRPIRLKELETGVGHAQGLESLAKVLALYRVRLGVSLPDRR